MRHIRWMKAKNLQYGFLLGLILVAGLFMIDRPTGDPTRVEAMDMSPDGSTLAVSLP